MKRCECGGTIIENNDGSHQCNCCGDDNYGYCDVCDEVQKTEIICGMKVCSFCRHEIK
jgi:hypothetical protein